MAMDINLKKEAEQRLIDLSKKAKIVIDKSGLQGQRAKVALALDISGSMKPLYQKGIVQRACERLLGLAVNFDDDGSIDIFLFGTNDYEVGSLHKNNFFGFVEREIYPKYRLEGTNYGGVMERILNKYVPHSREEMQQQPQSFLGSLFSRTSPSPLKKVNTRPLEEPVYVIFVTDGNNFDRKRAEEVMKRASYYGIFWKFVGIGRSSFSFLENLDNLDGRFIDNAHFFQLNDLELISDEELYQRLLIEFPGWIKLATEKGLLAQNRSSTSPVSSPTPSPSVRLSPNRQRITNRNASIQLRKGQKADLTKQYPHLHQVQIQFGWAQQGVTGSHQLEVDGSAFLLGPNGKAGGDQDIVFYGNPQGENGAVIHKGKLSSNHETMIVDLAKVPARVSKIAFTLTIYEAEVRGHHFSQLKNMYIRVVDAVQGSELMRFSFGEDFTRETAIVAAELYRYGAEWKVNAVGSGFYGGLKALCESYGIEVKS